MQDHEVLTEARIDRKAAAAEVFRADAVLARGCERRGARGAARPPRPRDSIGFLLLPVELACDLMEVTTPPLG